MKRLSLTAILLLLLVSLWSQGFSGRRLRLSKEEGLTDPEVTRIFRDSRRLIWIGTENGLNRYDGQRIRTYRQIGEGGLTDLNIKCIAEDAQGAIWIGTEFGLNRLDPFTETITRYYEGRGPGTIPYRWCNDLFTDRQGRIWLTTEKGLARYVAAADSFINYPVNLYGVNPRLNKFMLQQVEDTEGNFWLATSFGVKRFDPRRESWTSFHFPETGGLSLPENGIFALHLDGKGRLWAGSFGGGLLQYNPAKKQFEKVSLPFPGSPIITSLASWEHEGTLYLVIGTHQGLFLHQPGQGDLEPVSGFRDYVYHLKNLDGQQLWVGTTQGAYRLNAGDPAVSWHPVEGMETDAVYHFLPGVPAAARQYFLTQETGWTEVDLSSGKQTRHPLPAAAANILRHCNRWITDSAGYWISSVYGFGHYNPSTRVFRDYSALVQKNSGQLSTTYLARDPAGRLWISMRRSGLLVFDPVTGRAFTFLADTTKPGHIYSRHVNDLVAGTDGKIYFTCDFGLYQVDPATLQWRVMQAPHEARSISPDKTTPRKLLTGPGGRLWTAASRRIYRLADTALQPVYPLEGFSSFPIENMAGNQQGDVWILSGQTVYRTDTRFEQLRAWNFFVHETNARIHEITDNRQGLVLMAGVGGYWQVNDSLANRQHALPAPLISRVRLGATDRHLVSLQEKKFRSNFKDALEIELACPECWLLPGWRLQYRLGGWETDWRELSDQPIIRYEQLPPGRYEFMTRIVTGEEAGPVTGFALRVHPPFYLSAWFIAGMVILLGTSLYALYRYRLRKAVELEKLRTRIATDLHDDIGATLSSISMYSEAVKNQVKGTLPHLEPVLNRMGENSRDMVTSMSDIVWAINPDNDGGDKLAQRIENHARDLCAVRNVRLHYRAAEGMDNIRLSLEQRKNIYLVFKEALNNALKYAGATEIELDLERTAGGLELRLRDNGKGFRTDKTSSGNGIRNMQLRAAEIGGEWTLDSREGGGTTILLRCPL